MLELASTKPYGFMRFYPDPYAGGYCLVKDTVIYWITTGSELVKRAIVINERIPRWYTSRLCQLLEKKDTMEVLFHGCGYKPRVPLAYTPWLNPILSLTDEMRNLCPKAEVRFYDENIVKCRDFNSLDERVKCAELVLS